MIRILIAVSISAAMLIVSADSAAQQEADKNPIHNMAFPTLTAQHRQLATLAGDWAITGQTHKGCPYGEGKFTGTEHNELMNGGMFLVSRTKYSALFKNSSQVAIFGVDPNTHEYTYALYNSLGVAVQATGGVRNREKSELIGNAIDWNEKAVNVNMHADASMQADAPAVIYSTEFVSPNEYKFSLKSGPDIWYDGVATRVTKQVNPAH